MYEFYIDASMSDKSCFHLETCFQHYFQVVADMTAALHQDVPDGYRISNFSLEVDNSNRYIDTKYKI